MTSISATAFRQNMYNIINKVNEDCTPITITNNRGKGAVLIGEEDWAAIKETLYLMEVPGMTESLLEGRAERIEDCVPENALEW